MYAPHRPVALWLAACIALVAVMMVIGAVTRLTESGLSMMEWRPLLGAIPPLSDPEWRRVFALYRAIPEYRLENAGMSLAEFKTIFWWEYIHRLWGRLIGVVFFIPFVWFLITGQVRGPFAWRLGLAFVLGGLQGLLGWYMVSSGFSERTDVSEYRLAAHFGVAVLILGWLLWLLRDLVSGRVGSDGRLAAPEPTPPRTGAVALMLFIGLVALSGAFVAGLNAGLLHNQFPLMGGSFVPEDYRLPGLGLLANAFESHAAVQFHHRWLAVTAVVLALLAAWRWYRIAPGASVALGTVAVLQMCLGIATLLTQVWPPLATLHQAGAALLFGIGVWLAHRMAIGAAAKEAPALSVHLV